MRIKINGEEWNVYKLNNKEFDVKMGVDTRAITNMTYNPKTRAIYLREDFTKEDIIHELTHVYISYSDFGHPSATLEDNEEIICLLMEECADQIVHHANKIYKTLRN